MKNCIFYAVSVLVLFFFDLGICDDILGCGGFIKSHIPIEFSKIEIALYTKQGSLKDVTDCAPNNGYYFLPLYDHGEYVLKVTAPSGWNLEPSEVALTVDGETDPCSLGHDINFVFVGFAVSGKVVSEGSAEGPAGVKVLLLTEKGTEPILQVTTGAGGVYVFPRVAPGQYELRASHPQWKFSQDKASVTVSPASHKVVGKLAVAGYPVSGMVTSDKEPIAGVSFVLHGEKGKKIPTPIGCLPSPQGLCRAESGVDGRFLFPALAPGNYHVVPHYAAGKEGSAFDVRPREMRFTVEHDGLHLSPEFQVKGFTVPGRVLVAKGGPGVADAKVLLNGEQRALAGHDGSFRLENMRAGTYSLSAQADLLQFDTIEVRVSPGPPGLPDLIASSIAVCGAVTKGSLPASIYSGSRKVTAVLLPQRVTTYSATTDETSGNYCLMLPPGEYQVYVHVTDPEVRRGLKFAPPTQQVTVKDAPLKGIDFAPLKAILQGRVKCLQDACPSDISVYLAALHSEAAPTVRNVAADGSYSFTEVLPGQYEVTVKSTLPLCWEKDIQKFTVASAQSTAPLFIQTGYSMVLHLSHPATVEYFNLDNDKVGSVEAPVGDSSWCVPGPGPYMLVPGGCHEFTSPWYSWEAAKGPVNMVALKHAISGSVLSTEHLGDISVIVTREDDTTVTLGPLHARTSTDSKGVLDYQFTIVARPGELLKLVPIADKLLFSPPSAEITTGNECQLNAIQFRGDRGHFVEGKVTPPLENVEIKITQGGKVIQTAMTNKKGEYSVGPLPTPVPGQEYEVEAQLEGYQVFRGEDAGERNNFKARRLAQVIVRVREEEGGSPLPGVLLSFSGGEYRRNSQAGPDGTLTFHSLWPGDYFLRPKLKEYRFEPQSKMITVSEGATIHVDVMGKRVAFSCIGSVVSLNGEPEEELSLEAVGMGEACKGQHEESVTELPGNFRIRGLIPNCMYQIRMKEGAEVNKHFSRISPTNLEVKATNKDVTGIHVIAMRPPQHCDVSVLVVSAKPGPQLRLRLFRESEPDSPLLERKLEPATLPQHYTVLPVLPNDGRAYYIQVDSVSNAQHFREVEPQIAHFVANSSVVNIRVEIAEPGSQTKGKSKTGDDGEEETKYGSLLVLPTVLGTITLIVFYHSKLTPLAGYLSNTIQGLLNSAPAPPAVTPVPLVLNEELIVEPVLKRKSKARKT